MTTTKSYNLRLHQSLSYKTPDEAYYGSVDREKKHEGTGLGLSLVQKYTELHGGTVSIDSIPGKGSTFTIWILYITDN